MRSARRSFPASIDGALASAGVGDQDTTCPHGTEGCPGPNNPAGELPCAACFLSQGGDAGGE
jgi:hypothetical protein